MATVAGREIRGGMFYLGSAGPDPFSRGEMSLIDPALPVSTRDRDPSGSTMTYYPRYDEMAPRARATYLDWLTDGRRTPRTYIGYVFVFFYGLERRVLADVLPGTDPLPELLAVRHEVEELLAVYGENHSFRGYASDFADFLDFVEVRHRPQDRGRTPPPRAQTRTYRAPRALARHLSELATQGSPVPADWALAWSGHHPQVRRPAAATRCGPEFETLFTQRYTDAHGPGLLLPREGPAQAVTYRPANNSLDTFTYPGTGPYVLEDIAAGEALDSLVASVASDLGPLSRYLSRHPDGRGTLAAASALPADLPVPTSPQVEDLLSWARPLAEAQQLVPGGDLIARWPLLSPTLNSPAPSPVVASAAVKVPKLGKVDFAAVARLLEKFGLGIEPDLRFGGPPVTADVPLTVFHTGPAAPQQPSPSYSAAATLLHLAAAVATSDREPPGRTPGPAVAGTDPGRAEELRPLLDHLERALSMSAGERRRLEAHYRWLTSRDVKLTGLTRRVALLDEQQAGAAADLLVTVAAADGNISAGEIRTLSKIFKLLGLDPDQIHSRIHATLTRAPGQPQGSGQGQGGSGPAMEPVTMLPGGRQDPGHPLGPPPPAAPPPRTGPTPRHRAPQDPDLPAAGAASAAGAGTVPAPFTLDPDALEERFQQTAAVAALLTGIFASEDPSPAPGVPGVPSPAGATEPSPDGEEVGGVEATDAAAALVAGLDRPHSDLVRALAANDSWSRVAFDDLCVRGGALPAGALDRINEAALDACEELFLEDDGVTLTVNPEAREALLP